MADSRNIVRAGVKGAGTPSTAVAGKPTTVTIERAATSTVTARVGVDTSGSSDPTAILAQNPNRRGALIYNPATDPVTGGPGYLVWIGANDVEPLTFFPLEPGGTYEHRSEDWLYAWTLTAQGSNLYVIEERY